MKSFISREITGNKASELIKEHMSMATNNEWNFWYRRILRKDLRCGVSVKTVNKVGEGFLFQIAVFGCMLALDSKKHTKKLVGKCLIEYKYDGVRVVTLVKEGKATMYSRNGKVLENFPHITKAINKMKLEDCMLDSEVMSRDFQSLMKQVTRKDDVKTEDAYLSIFDALPLTEWEDGKSKKNTIQRKHYLDNLFDHIHKISCLEIVAFDFVDLDTEDGQAKFAELNEEALKQGYEGLMIKPIKAFYENKRSSAWLKVKPLIEVTLKVVGINEGEGKAKGMVGGIVCEGEDDGKFYKVNVGTGLSDKQRKDFWKQKDELIGQLVEIQADMSTQNQKGDAWSLRFPRFKNFRGFKKGEKI
jgi:DNA ligase-1